MLTAAYEFVRSGWCQGAAALDEYGRPIEPASAFARKWSALGALERAWRRAPEPPGLALEAVQSAKLALTAAVNDVPQAWNDSPDRHESQVLSALAEAVRLLGVPVAVPPPALDDLLEDVDAIGPRRSLELAPSPALPAEIVEP
ncbi:MAG: DUF6197 family protein [Gaiellaceae bacterium]